MNQSNTMLSKLSMSNYASYQTSLEVYNAQRCIIPHNLSKCIYVTRPYIQYLGYINRRLCHLVPVTTRRFNFEGIPIYKRLPLVLGKGSFPRNMYERHLSQFPLNKTCFETNQVANKPTVLFIAPNKQKFVSVIATHRYVTQTLLTIQTCETYLHPGKLIWNPKMEVWKMMFLSKSEFQVPAVSFRGSSNT